MIFKDIAEWEVGDSELAQHTITNLHSEIDRLKTDKEQLNSLVNYNQEEIRRLKSENDKLLGKNINLVLKIETLNNIINELNGSDKE